MRRVVVVSALALALAAGAGVQVHATEERRDALAQRRLVELRVDAALAAQRGDHAARADLVASADAASTASLVATARAELGSAVARGRATLDASAGLVADDAARQELASRLDAAQAVVGTASPALARQVAAGVAAAEQTVGDAVTATRAQAAADAERAARDDAARRPAASSGERSPAPDRCATTYDGPAFYTSAPTEGGDGSNGRLPASALAAVSWTRDSRGTPFYLRSDAAAALERLNVAFRAATGHDLALDLTYRDLDTQVAMREALGRVAAVPGTSSHGTGLALDVPELPCEYGWDSPARAWLVAHGPAYGWVSPAWARQDGSNPEYWHYEYRG